MTTWLPIDPLLEFVPRAEDHGGHFHRMGGAHTSFPPHLERALYRAKARGLVSIYAADDLACALGYHPVEIWGEDFYR